MNQSDTLATVAWGMYHFGAVTTGGNLRSRDIQRAIRKGLVKSVGPSSLCDRDRFIIHPERYREGYVLTDEGEARLRAIDPDTADFYLNPLKSSP